MDGSTTTPPAATLSGSATLNVGALNVGVSGGGMFTQSGGTITMPGTGNGLDLGVNAGSNGTYTMTGGQFNDAGATVGDKGTGSFIQSGGVHDLSNSSLYIGNQTGGNGSYTLSGTGQLLTAETVVGSRGTGLFTQTGGTATATVFLAVGFTSANGTYNLSGGSLISAAKPTSATAPPVRAPLIRAVTAHSPHRCSFSPPLLTNPPKAPTISTAAS